MAKKPNKRLSTWARHWQRIKSSSLVVITAPVRGVKGASSDATYLYAVGTQDRHGFSPLLVLPQVSVSKGDTVFLVPGRSEAGDELGYTVYRSAPNGDKSTLRAIADVAPVNTGHSKTITMHSRAGYYRDDFVPLESGVYVIQRGRLREREKR